MEEDLIEQKDKLIKVKYEYIKILKNVEEEIESIQTEIYNQCAIKNNGHKWIREKEEGPYGVSFFYCKYCHCGK